MKIVGHAPVRLALTLALAALIASLVQNGVVLAREHAKNRRLVLLTRFGVGTALFVVLNAAWWYASKQQEIGAQEAK
jgi:hypothetical protein